jgi:hypothetical protein
MQDELLLNEYCFRMSERKHAAEKKGTEISIELQKERRINLCSLNRMFLNFTLCDRLQA